MCIYCDSLATKLDTPSYYCERQFTELYVSHHGHWNYSLLLVSQILIQDISLVNMQPNYVIRKYHHCQIINDLVVLSWYPADILTNESWLWSQAAGMTIGSNITVFWMIVFYMALYVCFFRIIYLQKVTP